MTLLKPQTKKFIFGPFLGAPNPQMGALNPGFGHSDFLSIVWWSFHIDRRILANIIRVELIF